MREGKGHIPIRTCISCGAKRSKEDFIRLILDEEGRLIRDDQGKGQGRGAYVCNNKSCKEQLKKENRLNRAFRSRKSISISPGLTTNFGIRE